DLALFFADLRLADRDLAGHRDVLADAFHAGNRVLLPNRAGDPDLDSLGAHGLALLLAAVIATMAQLRQAFPERGATGDFAALIMSFVLALANDARYRHASPLRLHHRAVFHDRHIGADVTDDFLDLGNLPAHWHRAGSRYRDTLATVSRVILLTADPFVDGP